MTAVQDHLDRLVRDGVIVGGVGVLDHGGTVGAGSGSDAGSATGRTDWAVAGTMAVDGPPLRSDAIFRIQSMTKAVTAVATLRLVERGVLSLDDPIQQWLPELAQPVVLRTPDADLTDTVPHQRPITVRHLLTCGSGYGAVSGGTPLGQAMRDAGLEAGPHPFGIDADVWLGRLAALPLAHQPGDGWRSVAAMTTDQVPEEAKSPDSFGPDFWAGTGWGYGVGIETGVPDQTTRGRFGWSGGQGTDFSVDPATGRITLLLTQTELGPATFEAILGFREVDR